MKFKTALQTSIWYALALIAIFGGGLLVVFVLRVTLAIDLPLWMPSLVIAGLVMVLAAKNYFENSVKTESMVEELKALRVKIEEISHNTEQIKKAIEE